MKNIFISIAAFFGVAACGSSQDVVDVLEPKEFIAAAKSDTSSVLLDVRRPDEFAEGHIDGAVNLNWLDAEAFSAGISRFDKNKPYYIYCRSGRRSNAAAQKMKSLGFNVHDMKGGILKWQELGLPVVK